MKRVKSKKVISRREFLTGGPLKTGLAALAGSLGILAILPRLMKINRKEQAKTHMAPGPGHDPVLGAKPRPITSWFKVPK